MGCEQVAVCSVQAFVGGGRCLWVVFEKGADFFGEGCEGFEVFGLGEEVGGEGGGGVHLDCNWGSVGWEGWVGGFGASGGVRVGEEVGAFQVVVGVEEGEEGGCEGVEVGG